MIKIPFSELRLTPKVERAIAEMGFDLATPIQSEAIPLIRTGVDVIACSQTGTGKTVAFAIPAIEKVDTHEEKATIQVLILCPTRELAQQATDEFRKLAKFKTGIHPVEVYGGTSIAMQSMQLRRANIVIGTPGRVMDHMRRETLDLSHLKMIVLDEADEMLNMGFKEDIETILKDTPEDRQTILFAATMPPAILALTKEFQKDPQLIEIDKNLVTVKDIEQRYIDVPHDRKKDALGLLLQFHQPNRAIIFCNTKIMVDELTEFLSLLHFKVESIHSDIKQDRRTAVMRGFKLGKTSILIATDIAARGIDVSDVDFVINYDIPANIEYYIHRIGRTGRAGKSGRSITICCGNREVSTMRRIAFGVKSDIKPMEIPSLGDIQKVNSAKAITVMEEALQGNPLPIFTQMTDQLVEKGYSLENIAAMVLQMHFANDITPKMIKPIERRAPDTTFNVKKRTDTTGHRPNAYDVIEIDVGIKHHITVNHIIGAITEHTALVGNEIGKVKISGDSSTVEIPAGRCDEVLKAMVGLKICGKPVKATGLAQTYKKRRSEYESARPPYRNSENKKTYGASSRTNKTHRPRG